MNHLPYEGWILDEPELTNKEKESFANHLLTCKHCRQLKVGWEISKNCLNHPNTVLPASGFTNRWQKTLVRRINTEKVRRYRLSMFGVLMLIFTTSLIYTIASGSFLQILANFFSAIIRSIIAITNGLSSFGLWINKIPRTIPIAAGFIFLGLSTALMLAVVFLLWNLKNRKKSVYEITMD